IRRNAGIDAEAGYRRNFPMRQCAERPPSLREVDTMNVHVASGGYAERSRSIIREMKHLEGPMLPILHALQGEFGFIPEEVKPVIADELNLSRAEVHGVVTFYHDFRDAPSGRHVLKLCRAEACQAMGGDELALAARQLLGIDFHQ